MSRNVLPHWRSLLFRAFVATAGVTALFPINGAFAAGSHAGGQGHGKGFGRPAEASEATRTIDVTMEDSYFEPETIEVKAGETVRFLVKNKGELVHEFNIGTAAMHTEHQKEMAMMMEHGALEADRINRDMMKMDMGGGGRTMQHDDPNAVLLEPGQSAEVVWTFTQPMTLEFACNVPGHYEAGMKGKISVAQ